MSRRAARRAKMRLVHLTVVTGPPGAGKSTLAEQFAVQGDRSVLVPGDRFLGFVRSGFVDPWLDGSEEQNEAAWEASFRATAAYVAAGYDVVYDGIVYPERLGRVVALTGCDELSYVLLLPPVELCLSRIRDRPEHGFDDPDVTRQMHERFARSSIDERHVVREVDAAGRIAADVRDGRFTI